MMLENEARLFFVIAVLIGTFALSLARAGLRLIILLGLGATWRLRSWRKLGTLM
jgi:hypothetical protein